MIVKVQRLRDDGNATIGMMSVNNSKLYFTLEDEHRDVKVMGETRIPAGEYKLEAIYNSGLAKRYKERFGHEFAIGIADVPNFEHIRIHILNNEKQTEGCIGIGFTGNLDQPATISRSTDAYKDLYNKTKSAILGGTAKIIIKDE